MDSKMETTIVYLGINWDYIYIYTYETEIPTTAGFRLSSAKFVGDVCS